MINLIQGNLTPIRQSTLIEVEVSSAPTQNEALAFGNQNTLLDNAVITSIETYYDTIMAFAPSGRPLISQADLAKIVVTFADLSQGKNFEFIKNYPLFAFCTSLNSGIVKEILWRFLTLNKSQLTITDPSITPDTSVVFAINYWTPEQYALYLEQVGRPTEAKNIIQVAQTRKQIR